MRTRACLGLVMAAALGCAGGAPRGGTVVASAPRAGGTDDVGVPQKERAAAALARGSDLNEAWKYEEALGELERALRLFETLPARDRDDRGLAKAMLLLGDCYRGLGRWDDAKAILARRIPLAERSGDPRQRASAIGEVARAVMEAGDARAAIPQFEQAVAILEDAGIDDDDQAKMAYVHNLGQALGDTGDFAGAIELLERVRASDERVRPGSVRAATTLSNLALNYRDLGDLETAEHDFREALRIDEAELGPSHPQLAPTLNGLAGTLQLAGRLDEATALYRRSLALTRYGVDWGRAVALGDLGDIEVTQGEFTEARSHLDESIAILEQLFPDERGHPEIVRSLVKRARAQLGLKDLAAAQHDTAAAIRMSTALAAGDRATVAETIDWLADVWQPTDAGRAAALRAQAAALRD